MKTSNTTAMSIWAFFGLLIIGQFFFFPLDLLSQITPIYPSDGIVAWYPFDANAQDISGNNRHLVATSCSFGEDRFGIANNCLSFDSEIQGAYRWEEPASNLTGDFSVSLWFKTESPLQPDDWEGLYGMNCLIHPCHGGYGSTSVGGVGLFAGTDGIQVIEHRHLYVSERIFVEGDLQGWQHLVLTYDSLVPRIYLNGTLMSTGPVSDFAQTRFSLNDGVYPNSGIGRGFYPTGSPIAPYSGFIDELGIWNRALTQEEIEGIWQTNSDAILGCTNDYACNYNPEANYDDGSCSFPGCLDDSACNYDPNAACASESCTYPLFGMTDCNAAASACGPGTTWSITLQQCIAETNCGTGTFWDDAMGQCVPNTCHNDLSGDGAVGAADLLLFLADFGQYCE